MGESFQRHGMQDLGAQGARKTTAQHVPESVANLFWRMISRLFQRALHTILTDLFRRLDLSLHLQCKSNSSILTIRSATHRAPKHGDSKTPHLHRPCNSNWPRTVIKSASASAMNFSIYGLEELNSSAIIGKSNLSGDTFSIEATQNLRRT